MSPIWALVAAGVVLVFAFWIQHMGLAVLELEPMFIMTIGIFIVVFVIATTVVAFASPSIGPANIASLDGGEATGFSFSHFFTAQWLR